MKFPSINRKDLLYDAFPPLPLHDLSLEQNILEAVAKKDYMIYTPYQNFAYVIKFLREAALDPTSENHQRYPLSGSWTFAGGQFLINAAKNGKRYWYKSNSKPVLIREQHSSSRITWKSWGTTHFGVPA